MSTVRLLDKVITENLIVEKRGQIGWITFNDPSRHNAVSYDMWVGIPIALAAFAADDDIRAVVLTGAGEKAFVSGANIAQFEKLRTAADAVAEYERVGEAAQAAIYDFIKPTLARIQGYCIGGGLNISLCCDVRIASSDSSFAIPAGKLGLGYRLTAIRNLINTVGGPTAMNIMLSAARFTAEQALDMKLIQYVAEPAALDACVDDYLTKVAANAPLTLQAAKASIREFQRIDPHVDVAKINAMVLGCFASEDYQEGKRAFAEKRAPVFRGK